jgi:hypothetical protein
MDNLRALRLYVNPLSLQNLQPLEQARSLQHFFLQYHSWSPLPEEQNVIQSILYNSKSTLRSLVMIMNRNSGSFWKYWKENNRVEKGAQGESPIFLALELLHLSGLVVDSSTIQSLHRAVDFTRLRELKLGHVHNTEDIFLPYINDLLTSSPKLDKTLNLQILHIEMSEGECAEATGKMKLNFELKCRFISSFTTLKSLVINNYGRPQPPITTDVGLSDMMLQAILRHNSLEALKLSWMGVRRGHKPPPLSPATIEILIEGLSQLKELHFPLDLERIVG